MRILQVSDTINNIGGAEKVMHDITTLLRTYGHKVELWGTNMDFINQTIFSVFNLWYLLKLRAKLKDSSYDVIHIHKFNSILSSAIFLACKKKETKVILHIHDFGFYCYKLGITKDFIECKGGVFHKDCLSYQSRRYESLYTFIKWIKFILNRWMIKKYVNVFICPSRKLREYTISSLQVSPSVVHYIPNFIEPALNITRNNILTHSRLLFIGRISKEKGVDIAIRAVNLLIKNYNLNEVQFDIIGDGLEIDNLKSLVHELQIQNNIKFLGRIDNKELGQYYEKSGIILMPSTWLENNPLVALEAMKYGRPIIASNVGGFPDLIENGKNGYLFKMGNHIDLAEKILLLYGNKEKIINMGEYGFEKVKKEFNSEFFYNKLIATYEVNYSGTNLR